MHEKYFTKGELAPIVFTDLVRDAEGKCVGTDFMGNMWGCGERRWVVLKVGGAGLVFEGAGDSSTPFVLHPINEPPSNADSHLFVFESVTGLLFRSIMLAKRAAHTLVWSARMLALEVSAGRWLR